jgi:hypothetical protein
MLRPGPGRRSRHCCIRAIASWRQDCRYENPPPSPCSRYAVRRCPASASHPDVIVLAVQWYLRFGLSYRDVEELLAERGIEVDHVTV